MRRSSSILKAHDSEKPESQVHSDHVKEQAVVVAVNFNHEDEPAMTSALSYAQRTGQSLVVYHTVDPKQVGKMDRNSDEDWLQSANTQMDEFMKRFSLLLAIGEVPYHTHVDPSSISSGVQKLTSRYNVSIIVANGKLEQKWLTRSLNRFSSTLLGIKDIPILVAPTTNEWKNPQRIVLALNLNECYAGQQFEPLRKLGRAYDVVVQVLVVIKGSFVRKWTSTDLRNWLHGIPFEVETKYGRDVVRSINDYADQVSADLVSVISFPDHPFRSLFDPSVTKRLAPRSKLPLLVMK